jgi:hypothetical protein
MAASINSGPNITTGNTRSDQNQEPGQGPSLDFQGTGLTDPRFANSIGQALGFDRKIRGIYANPFIALVDGIPQALNAARIAALANVTINVPMTLVSAQGVGVSPNIPIYPYGQPMQASSIVNVLALDFGFTTGNTTATSKAVVIPAGAWKFFRAGQRILLSGAGATANSVLSTTVVSAPAGGTTLNIADAAGQTVNGVQIGSADFDGDTAFPWVTAGDVILMDPMQAIARAVSITGVINGTGGAFTVRGYDIYGQPMTEVITCGAGVNTVNGKKAFKYIASVTPGFTDAHTYSVGTTDIFGMSVRSDFWEYMNVYMNGAFVTVSTGWTVADATTPATSATGDVRGTYAVQVASDGVKRLAMFTSLPVYNIVNATNLDYSTLFGVTQV